MATGDAVAHDVGKDAIFVNQWLTVVRMSSTIPELLAKGPTFSYEFFPPKDAEGMASLLRTIDELTEQHPDFVSVTYGASGSSRDRTINVTKEIATRTNYTVMGHLTCTGQSVEELKATIDNYADVGIRHILAIRGDMPGGPTIPWEPLPGGLRNATELVELVASRGDFTIGVAAFPDVHPNGSAELDTQILIDKAAAGASFAITQLFFTPQRFVELNQRVRDRGVDLPIVAGVMPVTNIKQLGRFAEMSGAALPDEVVARLQAVAEDPDQVRAEGVEIGVELSKDLLELGAPGLHYFTQNRSVATTEILSKLREVR